MIFTSLSFFIFLAVTLFLFSVTPVRFRWLLLLVASYAFYAFLGITYLLLVLAAVTSISYVCGSLISRSGTQYGKSLWLWSGVAANLALLIWLKYLPFLTENLNSLFHLISSSYRISVPPLMIAIGVSYFVFQGISYLVDIYLEALTPEPHLGRFALFMCFFPKILQGPIERGESLLPQLEILSPPTTDNLRAGINLFLWGMLKKVLVADRLATLVDPVFNNVHDYHGVSLVIATYLFALQIYFDFSGYTDMALGIARLFNIRLAQNFNSPYVAVSIADFWRRWHISFSSWILDYIFKPLQFSFRNVSGWGTPLALILTFLASGIWHGASWCFIAWGLIHGIYLSTAMMLKGKLKFWKALHLEKSLLQKVWQVFITFHLVCFSWIFFRAATIKDALYIAWSSLMETPSSLRALAAGEGGSILPLFPGKHSGDILALSILVVLVAAVGLVERKTAPAGSPIGKLSWLVRMPAPLQGCYYGIFCYMILFKGASSQSFIYQNF